MTELKPCPFCGGDAESDTQRSYRALSGGAIGTACAVYCTKCEADISICMEDVSGWTIEEAISHVTERWNKRAALAVPVPPTEAATEKPYGEIMDEMDHQAKYQPATVDDRRREELRIHALGAAVSRRSWNDVEQAHAAIRDKFHERQNAALAAPVPIDVVAALEWAVLEEIVKASRTGISFDYIPSVEGEPSGFRFMRHHHIGEPHKTLIATVKEAIRARIAARKDETL